MHTWQMIIGFVSTWTNHFYLLFVHDKNQKNNQNMANSIPNLIFPFPPIKSQHKDLIFIIV